MAQMVQHKKWVEGMWWREATHRDRCWTCDQEDASSTVNCHYITVLHKSFMALYSCHKQYDVMPVNGCWCTAAENVTVGLTSHWLCTTDLSSLTTYMLSADEWEKTTNLCSSRCMPTFTLPFRPQTAGHKCPKGSSICIIIKNLE